MTTTQSTSTTSSTLKLSAKVNVMDVIADSLAIKNSLIRCAQVNISFS